MPINSHFILILSLGIATLSLTGFGMLVAYIVRFRNAVQSKELCNERHKGLEEINKERYDTLTEKIDLLTGIVLNGGKKTNENL